MPEEEYIRPEDVRPARARQVLNFLNAAQTAEEIATAVEIPDELDVGVRLGQRILDRREQLGRFANLQQVADIPLIGPERFTEIVTTLSPDAPPAPGASSGGLLHEIRTLREQVEDLRAAIGDRSRVVVRALQERPFLGQAVNVVATVTEAGGGQPLVDTPLTLTTTWGRLRAADGLDLREGNSVTTRTDGNGMARVLLLPPTAEDLHPVQQATLEVALRLLDPGAAGPRAIEDELQEIVRQYRWDGNPQLRRAIDIYFRDFGGGLLETLNDRDHMLAWSYLDSTVLAHVQDGAGDGSGATVVNATAALSIRFKNWLGPWLETIQDVAQEESRLKEDLAGAIETEETGTLLGKVYGRVRDFVSEQRGVVGDYVGRRIAEDSLRKFLQKDIEKLPLSQQTAVFPALDVASHAVASSDTSVLDAVGQTHSDLRQELNQKIDAVETEGIAVLSTQVENLQSQLDAKVDTTTFNTALSSKLDASEFNTFVSTFDNFEIEVNTQLAAKVDRTTFNTQIGTLQTRVDGFDILLRPDQ